MDERRRQMNWKYLRRDCWLEIDLDTIRSNFAALRSMAGPDIKIMPAVKANAYGHGIAESCRALEQAGADYLGVGNIDEAILLRENGIETPILIFAGNLVEEVADLYIRYNLIPTIFTVKAAQAISRLSKAEHPIFLGIETGRGRLGVNAEEFPDFVRQTAALPGIKIEGIYSHMAAADWPDKPHEYADWQYRRFLEGTSVLKELGLSVPFMQLANTPGSIAYPNLRLSGICPGRAVWGYSPLEQREGHPALSFPMKAWKSRLLMVKDVIGGKFGPDYRAVRLDVPKHIGVMAGGVSDGISPRFASGGSVLVCGKRVPVASSICLEHTILDLTDCPEAIEGDEVVLFGKQGDEEITMEELRSAFGRDLMEFWTGITPHVSRIYYEKGRACSITYGDKVEKIRE